jgi:transposase
MLLMALDAATTPDWMKTLPAITTLQTIWEQQFEPLDDGGQWRAEPTLSAAQLINSPYDLDARYGKKRTTLWVGYKVHFSQTCDEDAPQLITHVETTPAPLPDEGALSAIHTDLAEKELLPEQHLVDAGYVTIDNLVQSQSSYGLDEGPPDSQNALVSSGDWLRPHAFLHRLGSRDGDLPAGTDEFELDACPRCRQIADQGEVFPKRL